MDGEKGIFEWKYWLRLTHLKARINELIKNGVLKTEIHPFVYTKIPTAEPKECDLTIDEFRKIQNTEVPVAASEQAKEQEQSAKQQEKSDVKYRMTAIINGESISHEISQKQYDKFMAVDDYHRMKLFSNIFKEVDMKSRPEASTGLGTKIFAALAAGAVVTSEVAHGMSHHPPPEIYVDRTEGRHPHAPTSSPE